MGADAAVKNGGPGSGAGCQGQVTGRVIEELPSALYRVELENKQQVLAHPVGSVERNFVRLRPGDRVRLELSPDDLTRGRILKLES